VSEAKVTLSDEVGPTLDSLCHRVGLDRVCHADGGACRPGRESTPDRPSLPSRFGWRSNSGDASVLTGVIQTNRPKDHASDDHNNHDDHNDHYDDQSRNGRRPRSHQRRRPRSHQRRRPRPPKKTKHVSPTKLQKGTFPWRFNSLPSALRALWRVGTNNVVLQGALMRFQSVQGMITTGAMDGATWTSLVHAALSDQRDPMSYNDVVVDQALPEKLKLYQNGKVTFVTLVNTGVASAPTENGTYRSTCATSRRRCPASIPMALRTVTRAFRGFVLPRR